MENIKRPSTAVNNNNLDRLISATGLGDRAAFRQLYNQTSAKLFGVCLRILRDRSEAEDALQEIYIKIWNKSASFALTLHSPMSWLIAIARNHCIDVIRARKPAVQEIEHAFNVADDKPTPESAAMNTSQRTRIVSCLAELETRQSEAVCAAYVEGYSYLELAQRYHIPLNTIRTLLRRSLAKLKDCLNR